MIVRSRHSRNAAAAALAAAAVARCATGRPGTSRERVGAATGFSLVEVLLVLAILSVLAAIAAPRYGASLTNYRADAAAHRIVADLAAARSTSRARSRAVTVMFSGRTYRISEIQAPDGGGTYMVDLRESPYAIDTLTLDLGGTEIIFDGYGMPSTGGRIVLGVGHAERTIELNAATGVASIQR